MILRMCWMVRQRRNENNWGLGALSCEIDPLEVDILIPSSPQVVASPGAWILSESLVFEVITYFGGLETSHHQRKCTTKRPWGLDVFSWEMSSPEEVACPSPLEIILKAPISLAKWEICNAFERDELYLVLAPKETKLLENICSISPKTSHPR